MTRQIHIRARVVWPASQPPIADGAVLVDRGTITAVGRTVDVPRPAGCRRLDLGDMLVLPGLVNAHCHLDYTHMAGQIAPAASFTDWIKNITTLKASWSLADFHASWLAGAAMLVRRGITTVGDVEAIPALLRDVRRRTPLRVISFLEMTGVRSRREPRAVLRETLAAAGRLRPGRCRLGLSPHAPYSTVPELLRLGAAHARRRGWRLTTHVAESAEEYEMFRWRRGAMFDWLARNGRDMADCGGVSPVQALERAGYLGQNLLAVHVNHLDAGDAELLARRGAHVVHCPRSHAYFGHRPFPRSGLALAFVPISLGTDSLATVRRREELVLDPFAELREFLRGAPGLDPAHALASLTTNPARALGLEGCVGTLAPAAHADLIAIPFTGSPELAAEVVAQHRGDVAASMIGGRWALRPAQA